MSVGIIDMLEVIDVYKKESCRYRAIIFFKYFIVIVVKRCSVVDSCKFVVACGMI